MDLNRQVSPILWHGRIERHLEWQSGKKQTGRLQIQGDNIENLELIDLQLENRDSHFDRDAYCYQRGA